MVPELEVRVSVGNLAEPCIEKKFQGTCGKVPL